MVSGMKKNDTKKTSTSTQLKPKSKIKKNNKQKSQYKKHTNINKKHEGILDLFRKGGYLSEKQWKVVFPKNKNVPLKSIPRQTKNPAKSPIFNVNYNYQNSKRKELNAKNNELSALFARRAYVTPTLETLMKSMCVKNS
jgi:hypothetical protein